MTNAFDDRGRGNGKPNWRNGRGQGGKSKGTP